MHFLADRLNPEFIGIASKFAFHKKHKIEAQQKHKQLFLSVNHAYKHNFSLDRTLSSKRAELETLKGVRKRRDDDFQRKKQLKQSKEKQLNKLKRKSQIRRNSLKDKLQEAKEHLHGQRRTMKKEVDSELNQLKSQYEARRKQDQSTGHKNYQTVKAGKQMGRDTVKSFHLRQNQCNLQKYLTMIKKEDMKSSFYQQKIKALEKSLKKYQMTADSKQKELKKVLEEIDVLRQKGQVQRLSMGGSSSNEISKQPVDIILMDDQ